MIRVRARIAAPVSRCDPHWPMHWPRHISSRTAGTRSHIRHIGRSIVVREEYQARASFGFIAKQVGEWTICRVSSTVQLQVELISNWTTKSILELRIGLGKQRRKEFIKCFNRIVLSTKRTQFFYFYYFISRLVQKIPICAIWLEVQSNRNYFTIVSSENEFSKNQLKIISLYTYIYIYLSKVLNVWLSNDIHIDFYNSVFYVCLYACVIVFIYTYIMIYI